ncbi:hypothetical protein [Saccharospirillum sp.]|uniref:hypothetical protein n=1 Tax=Saccharospirillum sp. TaxID=2033801 RepID=UPI00349FDA25
MTEAKSRLDANVSRLHAPRYSSTELPPLPPRIRLAARCWERVWNLTLSQAPSAQCEPIKSFAQRFNTEVVTTRGFMRSNRKLCFAITGEDIGVQAEFELAMTIMARLESEYGPIERVEDRPAQIWPYQAFNDF